MDGWVMVEVYAPRLGLASHTSEFQRTQPAQSFAMSTGVRRGNLQRSCHVITLKH